MIDFQDFFPQIIEDKGFFADAKYESFSLLVNKVNQWISETEAKVINIETVVLRDKDSERTRFLAEEPFIYQFIRVWYEGTDEQKDESST